MYNNNQKSKQGFPDPLEPTEVKESKEYGIQYAKAIESQWGKTTDEFLDSINSELGAALEQLVPSAMDTNLSDVDVIKKG